MNVLLFQPEILKLCLWKRFSSYLFSVELSQMPRMLQEEKQVALDMLLKGAKIVDVAAFFGVHRNTIGQIWANRYCLLGQIRANQH